MATNFSLSNGKMQGFVEWISLMSIILNPPWWSFWSLFVLIGYHDNHFLKDNIYTPTDFSNLSAIFKIYFSKVKQPSWFFWSWLF
jgi:hypothetical protein